jgi:hypothetical protein
MEKYGVHDVAVQQRRELREVRAALQAIEATATLTKEAAATLAGLAERERELVSALVADGLTDGRSPV